MRREAPPGAPAAVRVPRVWLINLFFGGGLAPTGVLLESLARGLQAQGWQVEVVTGRVEYNAAATPVELRFDGRVRRLFSGVFPARGLLGRLLSWASFYLAVVWFAFTRRLPDQVVVLTTPPFLHCLFVLRNLLTHRKAELVLWNQDTYPEVLASVGLLRPTSWLFRALLALQRWGTSRMDRVVVLDEGMRQRLLAHGARRTDLIPNWEVDFPSSGPASSGPLGEKLRQVRRGYRYLILYTGNYGWGHDLGTLFGFLRQSPQQRTFYFAFVGGGEKWGDLLRARDQLGLECLEVASYVPKAQFSALLQEADFGLVALERACVGLMSPSKIHSYLARGKPLIYVGPTGSNVADALAAYHCGFRIEEDDQHGWQRLADHLASPAFSYTELAENASRAAHQRYNEAAGIHDFLALLERDRNR